MLDILTVATWKKTYFSNFPLIDISKLQQLSFSECHPPLTRVLRSRPKKERFRKVDVRGSWGEAAAAALIDIEPRSHDDLPSVPTPPRIDSYDLFLTLFYPLYSSLYPLPRLQHTYHGGRPGRLCRQQPIYRDTDRHILHIGNELLTMNSLPIRRTTVTVLHFLTGSYKWEACCLSGISGFSLFFRGGAFRSFRAAAVAFGIYLIWKTECQW